MNVGDTISAIATPIGEGALAIIRLSGPAAISVASRLFRGKPEATSRIIEADGFEPRKVYCGYIVHNGELIDETLLTVFRKPKSYTREDTAEFTSHGGRNVTTRILTATLQEGSRLAEPGEFTKRAFLNGRIDLTQAEAVGELIRSASDSARVAAIHQLQGSLRGKICSLRDALLNCLAEIEAFIDFPEEAGVELTSRILQQLLTITASLEYIYSTRSNSRILREGFRVPIVGVPNVGKSSLLNCLVGRERAIVSSIPGTTRDTIDQLLTIEGLPFCLVDTAGLRKTENEIEELGVERTNLAMENADIIVCLLEAGRPLMTAERALLRNAVSRQHLVVVNKIDLNSDEPRVEPAHSQWIEVSAKTGQGIQELKNALVRIAKGSVKIRATDLFLTNERHIEALDRGRYCLEHARSGVTDNLPLELIAADVRMAMNALGEIIGQTTNNDILDRIFSQLCIGK